MNQRDREKVGKDVVEALYSLSDAIYDGGGHMRLGDLVNLTITDFITQTGATNRIHFCHKPQPVLKHEKNI